MENCHTWIIISMWQNDLHTNTSRSVWPILYGLMIKMLQYKMYPAGELAVLRQLLFKKEMGILWTPSSVCLSILAIWPRHGKGGWEQHYFSVHPCVHPSVHLINPPKPLGRIQPNLLHATSLPLMGRVCESNVVCPCVWFLSICLSRYLLNHWAEFNQACFTSNPPIHHSCY